MSRLPQPPAEAAWSRSRALRTASLVAITFVAVYALAGFLLVPWLAKRELPRLAAEQLQRRAQVGEIRFNPFSLAVRVRDFALAEQDGRPLLAFREAYVNLEWRSLVRRAWVLSELRLAEPAVHIEISQDGKVNLAALALHPHDAAGAGSPVRFAIDHVAIDNGRIDFVDIREGYRNALEHITLDLSAVSTLDAKNGPHALTAQTADGARLRWNGELSLQPLVASGALTLEHSALPQLNPYLDNQTGARITAGRADVELPYRFSISNGKPRFEIRNARILLQDTAFARRDADAPFARVGQFALEGITIDLPSRRVAGDRLRVADFALTATRDERGELDLVHLFPGGNEKAQASGWQFNIASVELAKGTLSLADRPSGHAVKLDAIRAKLGDLSSDTAKPLIFEFTAALDGGGSIALNGRAIPQTTGLEARVEASGIPLALLQPILTQHAHLQFASGTLSLKGELQAGGETAKLSYSGSAAATEVAIADGENRRLLAWKSLSTASLRASLRPGRAEIDELRWVAPAARLAIAADGSTTIGRLFKDNQATDEQNDAEQRFAVAVRRIRVEHGTLDFSDDSITPGFTTRIHELSGTVNGVSSDRATRSQLALEGGVDEHGFARVSGTLNAFEPSGRTDLRVRFRNLDVTKVSPYTVKFAGYRVASGRMSLDLRYRVRDRLLEGDNQLVLEHFTLGERVESPTALKLPLELAVALLKDANGVIDIGVPISGNLDDPQFDYGALIRRAIANFITSVVTAPFRLLGRLFGGREDEELGTIAFEPGSSRLLPPEREKARRIAEALAKRPELKLVIPARYDAESDARALKRGALRRELAKRAGFEVGDEDPPGPLSIEDQRTRNAVRSLFAERFSDAELDKLKAETEARAGDKSQQEIPVLERLRKLARGEPQVADATEFYRTLGRRLIASQPLPEGVLDELGQKRAATLAAALREAGVDASRIALSKAEPTTEPAAKEVTLQLSLAPMR